MANPQSASFLIVAALFLSIPLLITKAYSQQPIILNIDVDSDQDSNSSLQYYLCGTGIQELVSDTTVQLSRGVHHLEEDSFCLLQNLENISIQGQQETQPCRRTVIYYRSENETRRGIAFFNNYLQPPSLPPLNYQLW